MNILSIETTTENCSIAILESGEITKEYIFKSDDAANTLIPSLDFILGKNGRKISDYQRIVVSTGPGSWTGIRLGISFAKGLALGQKDKLYSVTVPESLFFAARQFSCKTRCIINAYRKSFYISFFNGRFFYKKGFPIEILKENDLFSLLLKKDSLTIGPGISVLPPQIKNHKNIKIFYHLFAYPRASYNAALAEEKIKRGIPSPPLEPYYGR
jgi:tRNA threonylcarbamoyl adenosine modification protein YeaZ